MTPAEWVVAAQSVLVVCALSLSVWATTHGLAEWRPWHAAIAGLCVLYLGAYLYLLILNPPRAAWSEWTIGISFVTWPVAWTWPAWQSIKSQRAVAAAERKVAAARERIGIE